MANVERLQNVNEIRCPYCHERGSLLIMTDAAHLPIRVECRGRIYYVHKKCMDIIIQEWLVKYGPKQDG